MPAWKQQITKNQKIKYNNLYYYRFNALNPLQSIIHI